jgi:uncharacterized protein YeaO (DUF488 family)
MIRLKRIYEPPSADDGIRVLVDRLWPRGISKERAKLDHWLKEIAPTGALRKWFAHDQKKWAEFRERYIKELRANRDAVATLKQLEHNKTITLLFAAKDEAHNEAVVIRDYIKSK